MPGLLRHLGLVSLVGKGMEEMESKPGDGVACVFR